MMKGAQRFWKFSIGRREYLPRPQLQAGWAILSMLWVNKGMEAEQLLVDSRGITTVILQLLTSHIGLRTTREG